MRLVVYGSFNCPYSYLASRRATRLAELGAAEVQWRAIVHDPDVPPGGLPVDGDLAATLDRELEEVRSMLRPGETLAVSRPPHQPDTTAAVAAWAATSGGRADALRIALFDAYWVQGLDIGDPDVLAGLGCPPDPATATAEHWREEWLGLGRPIVPMMVLPDGKVSRGLGALGRLADLSEAAATTR